VKIYPAFRQKCLYFSIFKFAAKDFAGFITAGVFCFFIPPNQSHKGSKDGTSWITVDSLGENNNDST